jgi:hypothetical protein
VTHAFGRLNGRRACEYAAEAMPDKDHRAAFAAGNLIDTASEPGDLSVWASNVPVDPGEIRAVT